LLRLELQTIHEYQADEKVLAEGANAKNYHLSLIRQCVGEYKFALANNFEYNNLHKRIKMTMKTKSSSRQKWLYGTIGLSVMLCIVVLSFNGLKAKAADLKEMIKSELLPAADSTKNSIPAVVRIRKVAVKNNETVTPQIIIRDTVAPYTKNKVRTSQNENIRVVGYGTLNGAKPLIIVDGVESSQDINPNSVDKIEVLKDASTIQKYGEKGKNGVVLVTTKKNANNPANEKIIIRVTEIKNTDTDDKNQVNKTEEIRTTSYSESVAHQVQSVNNLAIRRNGKVDPNALIIIDGVTASSKDIDPNKIDKIEVLKDVSAVRKYGDKAKNGVIVVTTKKNLTSNNKNEEIKVIGYRSLTGAKPLIPVDGKEAPANPIQISIANIEAITIPKDTATTR